MVKLKVDMDRRNQLRRLHTATHIINHAAREVLGNHVWQNGSNLKPELGTLDITHYETLTQEQIFVIEKLANATVFADKKVTVEELSRAEAEKKYGYTVYQGGAIPLKTIRVIHVEDSDIEACGGTHMQSTGGIGMIKIVDSQKIQDGVVRLSYVVGEFALAFTQQNQELTESVAQTFAVGQKDIVRTADKFFKEWKEQRKVIEKLEDKVKAGYLAQIMSLSAKEFALDEQVDMNFMVELFAEVLKKHKSFKLSSPQFILATSDVKVKEFKKEIKKGDYSIYIR